ncbi:hypothetical protein NDU88_003372 [Pleurodeles waltl]|uniref:Uncharacterized protein n=1 Tax=Pleurodeles waltl TaxID=8319 RepID=A0AAV7RCX4_PLEWA|nr:hypothetical protein NDU88_003372 [Pleurodeles waltl]
MCRSTPRSALRIPRNSETRQIQAPGKVLSGRLRHWGRAALELRPVRKGSVRIPLWGNPARASIGKAPGKESREPDSATMRLSTPLSTKGGKTRWWERWGPGAFLNTVLVKFLGKCPGNLTVR